MLIIKEGLTDQNAGVRDACIEFLKPSMMSTGESQQEVKDDGAEGSAMNKPSLHLNEDLSYLFRIIDCKQMFIKEYYIQLPFIIMRFVFHLAGNNDLCVARYLESLLTKLKTKSGVLDEIDIDMSELAFEEILFLRIAYEFTKMYRSDRSAEFGDYMDKIALPFEEYSMIFQYLSTKDDV